MRYHSIFKKETSSTTCDARDVNASHAKSAWTKRALSVCALLLCMLFALTSCPDNGGNNNNGGDNNGGGDNGGDTTPPSAVDGFVIAKSNEQVTLSWINPIENNFDHIEITWDPPHNGGKKILSAVESGVAGDVKEAIIAGLTNNTNYTFAIIMIDSAGNKSAEKTAAATPDAIVDTTNPNTVTLLADSTADGQITVTWTNPLDSDFNHIEITWIPSHNGGKKRLSAQESSTAGATNSVTIPNLTNSTSYAVTIVAIDTSGNSSQSVIIVVIPEADTDGDGVPNHIDLCPTGESGWISAIDTDNDTDGCQDSGEDMDDDNDNYPDIIDQFPKDSSKAGDFDNDSIDSLIDVDYNNDGLIDILNLNMLNNMRYDLTGDSYKESITDSAYTVGASTIEPAFCNDNNPSTLIVLCGYELIRSLDFADRQSYANSVIIEEWRPNHQDPAFATNVGFTPIGGDMQQFSAIFSGNNHTIRNLYIRSSHRIGLFGEISSTALIRNIGIVDNAVYGGAGNSQSVGALAGRNYGTVSASYASGDAVGDEEGSGGVGTLLGGNRGIVIDSFASGNAYGGDLISTVGALVGWNDGEGTIRNSSASGNAYGGASLNFFGPSVGDSVGGLVGNNIGTVSNSSASGNAYGGAGDMDLVGALVGQNRGIVSDSYAAGNADGGVGFGDRVGSLVGDNSGMVIASYASGNAYGGGGNSNIVGALVGYNTDTVIASYATGNAHGSVGDSDYVGGLVGLNNDTVISSYATGNAYGVGGNNDRVGGLVGWNEGTVNVSYATGNADGGAGNNDVVGSLMGYNNHMVNASYASGTISGGELNNTIGNETLADLQKNSSSNIGEDTPFYRWAIIPDGSDSDTLPDWEPETDTEKLAVYCDSDGSGAIESAEEVATNYVWDFGTINQTPAITCTPGGVVLQQ